MMKQVDRFRRLALCWEGRRRTRCCVCDRDSARADLGVYQTPDRAMTGTYGPSTFAACLRLKEADGPVWKWNPEAGPRAGRRSIAGIEEKRELPGFQVWGTGHLLPPSVVCVLRHKTESLGFAENVFEAESLRQGPRTLKLTRQCRISTLIRCCLSTAVEK